MPTRLTDYTPPAYLVDDVHLTFALRPEGTRVRARLAMRPNPEAARGQALHLMGRKLRLISAAVDGRAVTPETDAEGLTVPHNQLPDGPFTWEAEVEIDPATNTELEGLYMSNGMYCTQCEAEGFRKITYYPDRPDVMATFTVRIEGDAPVMLSNGNPTASGDGWAEWHDPWPKPSYLFALVAGDLVSFDDSFTTMSGRKVDLKIYVRPGDEAKCAYAMDALKRSMRWDEEEYGREYDLDLFMIVAVSDFNMGAMENKGLNIFNSKYVLASPETATDRDYELIEGIIAHEYFHNWTGNRITCRDWFQLSLKEGLTVFRDQQFSGDQRSHAVKRIESVLQLRARQFREDAGPLAHPVRPTEYEEINNFYTATVYEKGAEVISMLRGLVGPEAYRRALDLYFERHDGQACTIEDWLKVFEDATGRDLAQFKLWYEQAGTPRVSVHEDWDGATLTLTMSQSVPDTPGQINKKPMVIPVAAGLIGADGTELLPTRVLELTDARHSFTLRPDPDAGQPPSPPGRGVGGEGGDTRPIASLLRGFSAPLILERTLSQAEKIALLAHDTDPFCKWEAGRILARDLLCDMVADPHAGPDATYLDALANVLGDHRLDPEFRALALSFPSIDETFTAIRDRTGPTDPLAVHEALRRLDTALAEHVAEDAPRLYDDLRPSGPYSPAAGPAGQRTLRGRLLGLLTRLDPEATLAQAQFDAADNMTEAMQALSLLVRADRADNALARFHEKWQADQLVLDKWFSVQAMSTPPETAAATVTGLTAHPDFDWKNPNRFRSLLGAFAVGNMAGFHSADGSGYRLLTDWLLKLDPLNPQTTARLAGAFETWRQFDAARQGMMQAQLRRIADAPGLSKNTAEVIGKILGSPA